jgi:hypothetical protein
MITNSKHPKEPSHNFSGTFLELQCSQLIEYSRVEYHTFCVTMTFVDAVKSPVCNQKYNSVYLLFMFSAH